MAKVCDDLRDNLFAPGFVMDECNVLINRGRFAYGLVHFECFIESLSSDLNDYSLFCLF